MIRKILIACLALAAMSAPAVAQQQQFTPRGSTAVLGPANVAVSIITGPSNGCYITNPLSATDQGVAAAEVVYVNPVTTATTAGNGTTVTLSPGQTWYCIPFSTLPVSAIAATRNHKLSIVRW